MRAYIKALEEYVKALEIGYNTGDLPENIIEISGNVETSRKEYNMGKRGPQPTGKTTEVIRISKEAKDAIRRLASDLGLSQSEVVDRAMQALAWMIETGKFIIDEDEVETAMKEESK